MTLPDDYVERTYAGVLGKIIGVYLGRPFEGWSYDRIMAELGEITYYVHDKRGAPLILTDDDISGTFTFPRALPDYGNRRDLTAQEIGQTWLNYIIERRTTLSWAGLGNSTEHTAYLRLKRGIPAPQSGSSAVNTQMVAEQIGAQIFIDGWAMVAPGDPELAVYLARQAASVSHDGEAIYGAQVIAAMEALAYVESDLNRLLDTVVSLISPDSIIRRLIGDLREWRAAIPDWRATRKKIVEHYGYHIYRGGPHIVPNHGLVIMALLYGDDDFQKSLMIVNTSGWDTDCNSGNVGCLLGIKNGLAGIEAGPDWRGPVADRLYIPSADGAGAITDAGAETLRLVNIGRALVELPPIALKRGSRFHFELPGSVQAFAVEGNDEFDGVTTLKNVEGHSALGTRSLAIRYHHLARGRQARVMTPTFIPPEDIDMPGYGLQASPTLYPGQIVRAGFMADAANRGTVECCLAIQTYGEEDKPMTIYSPCKRLEPGEVAQIEWQIENTNGAPIFRVGLEIRAMQTRVDGTIYLDFLTWDGEPDTVFCRPKWEGTMWRRAWVNGVDSFDDYWPEAFRVIQNEGTGLLIQGARTWTNYSLRSTIVPHMFRAGGIAARVQGMRRYYALLLTDDGHVRLVKALDGDAILAEMDYPWRPETGYLLGLDVSGTHLTGWIDGQAVLEVEDTDQPLSGGGIALICTEGRMATEDISVSPL